MDTSVVLLLLCGFIFYIPLDCNYHILAKFMIISNNYCIYICTGIDSLECICSEFAHAMCIISPLKIKINIVNKS